MNNNEHAPINWPAAIMFTITTLVTLVVVPWYGLSVGYSLAAWLAYFALTSMTELAITAGYHRLWSHNTYNAHWSLRLYYALFGAMALQNSILLWCSGHRTHHRFVDDVEKDPYSAKRGLWFSHMGWMLRNYESGKVDLDNTKNLQKDPIVLWQHKHYLWIALAMNLIVPVSLGLLFGNVWEMILLAGFLRIVTAHHFTFFINSIVHKWGSQPYTDENTARDNGFFALLTHGEGYHNFHHIFQNDYRNGVRWWQWDPTKWFIALTSYVGLSKDLKRISNFKINRARVQMQFKRAEEKLKCGTLKESWAQQLEAEHAHFKQMLERFTQLQTDKYQNARRQLQMKWENAALHTHYKELEYALKMQQKRMKLLLAQLA